MKARSHSPLLVLALLLLGATPPRSAAAPPHSDLADRGPVWAYGHEVAGEPWFETRGDTLYYHGIYPFWPRRPRSDAQRPDTTTTEAQRAATRVSHQVWSLARQASDTARTTEEWFRLFTGVLDQHRDVVTKYEIDDNSIAVWFAGQDFFTSTPAPRRLLPASPEPSHIKDKTTVRAEQEARFWKAYQFGCWILWGSRYEVTIPPPRKAETIAAIDSVNALLDAGFNGEALRAALLRLHLERTTLQTEGLLQDLLNCEGR